MTISSINPQVLDFLKRMADDAEFRAQFEQTDDQSEILSKLRDAGYDFSFEEFQQTMKTLAETSPDALPDDLLAGVSGGNGFVDFIGKFGEIASDVIKSVGNSPFPGVDASGLTDWASDKLAHGIKSVAKVFK